MKQVVALIVLLAVAGPSGARTWSVEQDGSGDWVTIQEAVDASASGDTILIAAGRYSELHLVPGMVTTMSVAHLLEAKDLTVIGEGPGETIIGPESLNEDCSVFFFDATSALVMSDIQIVNAHSGVWAYGDVELRNCTVDGCLIGVWVDSGDVWVSDCHFLPPVPAPITTNAMAINYSPNLLIERCHIENLEIYISGVTSSTVRDCVFEHPLGNNATDSAYYVSSNGVFERNRTDGRVVCNGGSHVVLRDNEFLAGISDVKLYLSESSTEAEIYDNVFHGGSFSTFWLGSAPSLFGTGNHILNSGSEYSVKLKYYGDYNNNPVVDLRGNYWGTDDPAQIDAWIYDIHDDPDEDTEVLYQPFSDVPLPADKESIGGFKSLYR